MGEVGGCSSSWRGGTPLILAPGLHTVILYVPIIIDCLTCAARSIFQFIVHNHRVGISEVRFCLQWAFKHALLLCVPLCVSWAFLFCFYQVCRECGMSFSGIVAEIVLLNCWPVSALLFDSAVSSVGVTVSQRWSYDVARGWNVYS